MDVLHKAMATILGSPQLRDALLYTNLLLIFGTAWVSGQWPNLAVAVIAILCVLLIGEGLLIYAVKRRAPGPPDA
jgi:hypothetical protein